MHQVTTDVRDRSGYPPLGVAIMYHRTEVETYLLEQGYTLNYEEKSMLMFTVCGGKQLEGRLEVVKKLVEVYKCPLKGEWQLIYYM